MTIADHWKFVFVGGLHRSGTSPLFRILREHPQISGFHETGAPEDEGQHLQTVFPPAKAYGGPGRFGFDKEAHLTEKSKLVTAENREKLFKEWSRHWDLSKPYLLEKSPPNLIRTRFLQAMFTNSCFIVIYRHPIAASLATQKWTSSNLESLVEHWLHSHRLFELDRRHLRHVHALKYEDLIASTQLELGKIYRFLNLEPHYSPPLHAGGNDAYFCAWQKLSNEPDGRIAARRIISRYRRKLRPYGYDLGSIPTTPTAPADCSGGKELTGDSSSTSATVTVPRV